MLRDIGRRARPATTTVVAALGECHARIRGMLALARTITGAPDTLDARAELQDACARVERYFREALPLHVADEDELVWPIVLAAYPDAAADLRRLSAEHGDHGERVGALLAALAHVRATPDDDDARARLATATAAVEDVLEPHLHDEEHLVFPRLATLGDAEHARLLEVMAARRRSAAP